MAVLITGGNGFLAQQLANTLLKNNVFDLDELILVDIVEPTAPADDPRVKCLTADLTEEATIEQLFERTQFKVVFHLAAIVSAHAERDIDLGHKVNVQLVHRLLEAVRKRRSGPSLTRLVFTSSYAVYGCPQLFDTDFSELTALLPQTAYGTQKAISELLINDYTRKGWIDGRVVRLPTITVRKGPPNRANTYFIQALVKEPLDGKPYVCPVNKKTKKWVSSPQTLVKNLIHAAKLSGEAFGPHRTVNLPGITVSVEEVLNSLSELAGPETAKLVSFELNEDFQRTISSVPHTFNVGRAFSLGFFRDENYKYILQNYISTLPRKEQASSSSSSSSDEN